MAFLLYFGTGLTTLGVLTVIFSIVSPEQGGGPGTIALGVGAFAVGIAVLVVARRRASPPG